MRHNVQISLFAEQNGKQSIYMVWYDMVYITVWESQIKTLRGNFVIYVEFLPGRNVKIYKIKGNSNVC